MTPTPPLWMERATLLAGDMTPQHIQALARSGRIHRIRRGRYVPGESWAQADEQEQHRIRAAEIGHGLGGRAVISHESAALMLGLELPDGPIPRVHVTWPGSPGRRPTSNVTPHRGRIQDCDIQEVDGVLVTTPARTLFDVSRLGLWHRSISVADCALRLQLCSLEDLQDLLNRTARVPGACYARKVFEFADGRSESVGESICRLKMAQLGLPAPTLQSTIPELVETLGARIALGVRMDFELEQFRTVAEFDGKIKYGRLLKPGQEPGEVVFDEKVREDRIRDTGRECVRVIWADFGHGLQLQQRFAAAFRRAGFPDWQPGPGRFLVVPRAV